MSLAIDGDIYITMSQLAALKAEVTGLTATYSSSFGDLMRQEETVTNVGIAAGIYDPEWAAIFAMET
jgi:hypothetical protein